MSAQLDVFNFDFSGHYLVEAGAGTGKTYNIASLYVRALVEKKLMPSQILVLTFTNDATAELKNRLRSKIQDIIRAIDGEKSDDSFIDTYATQLDTTGLTHLKNCLFSFDDASISTIHGFCQRILMEHHLNFGISANFTLQTNIDEIIDEAADLFWEQFFFEPTPSSEFERWYFRYLNLEFQSPVRLLELVKHFISNPDIEVRANTNDFSSYESYYESCKAQFLKLKECFNHDIETLNSFYYSKALNGNKYRNREQLLEDFSKWIDQDESCPKIIEKFLKFGSYMIEAGTNKNQEIPNLSLFSAVDNYNIAFQKLKKIEITFKWVSINRIRKIVSELKNKREVLGYNDLLICVRDGLINSSELTHILSKRYPIAFIDEFQDTDHIQYSIFDSIYKNQSRTCLVMIGDPKQAIYRFRGADINTYLEAKRRTDEARQFSLNFNYRSSSQLIRAVNALFEGKSGVLKMDGLEFYPAKFPQASTDYLISKDGIDISPLQVIKMDSNGKFADHFRSEIANSVATEVVELLQGNVCINNEKVKQEDIAVLVDTHRNAEILQAAFWNLGLGSIIRSKTSVFESIESDELYRLLSAIAHPSSSGYLKSALITSLINFNANNFFEIGADDSKWESLQAIFLAWNSDWQKRSLQWIFNSIEEHFDVFQNLCNNNNPERSITNYKHLKELLIKTERENNLSALGVLKYFKNKRNQQSIHASDEDIIRLESDESLIQIVTHHASKGLEYPIVFCPFLWGFSIKSSQNPVISNGLHQIGFLDDKSTEFENGLAQLKEEDEAEKIRLAYVALTRAKAMCFLYHNVSTEISKNSFNATQYLMNENEVVNEAISSEQPVIASKQLIISDKKIFDSSAQNLLEIEVKQFHRKDLQEFNKLVSFSSLAQKHTESNINDEWAFDFDGDNRADEEDYNDRHDIFSLPKGKDTGNLIHGIFEKIDFSDYSSFEPIINNQLSKSGFDVKWKTIIEKLIQETVAHFLIDDVRLDMINSSDRIVEMEFNFPINKLNPKKLFEIIGKPGNDFIDHINGYMKGFIDLIFRVNGKYYILDYKTNHLGDSKDEYSEDKLSLEIRNADYDLQYHIYLLAFVRYMKFRKPAFDYDKEFAGVIYLFLRGVDHSKKGSGVFFHKPSFKKLLQIDQLMKGKEGN